MALNNKAKATKNETPETTYDIEVTRAKQIKESYAFDMKVNGVMIYGCWLMESKDGNNFVSFPSYKGKDGKYYSHVYFKIDEKVQAEIEKQIESKLAE
jgi:hypothetical protein